MAQYASVPASGHKPWADVVHAWRTNNRDEAKQPGCGGAPPPPPPPAAALLLLLLLCSWRGRGSTCVATDDTADAGGRGLFLLAAAGFQLLGA